MSVRAACAPPPHWSSGGHRPCRACQADTGCRVSPLTLPAGARGGGHLVPCGHIPVQLHSPAHGAMRGARCAAVSEPHAASGPRRPRFRWQSSPEQQGLSQQSSPCHAQAVPSARAQLARLPCPAPACTHGVLAGHNLHGCPAPAPACTHAWSAHMTWMLSGSGSPLPSSSAAWMNMRRVAACSAHCRRKGRAAPGLQRGGRRVGVGARRGRGTSASGASLQTRFQLLTGSR